MYLPKQKDIVWVNFDPSKGREIRKRRPAVVLSSNPYNKSTHFIIVAPVTSTIRSLPSFFTLSQDYKTRGQVNCQQLYSYDCTKRARRKVEFIETMKDKDFYEVAQLVKWDFDFGF